MPDTQSLVPAAAPTVAALVCALIFLWRLKRHTGRVTDGFLLLLTLLLTTWSVVAWIRELGGFLPAVIVLGIILLLIPITFVVLAGALVANGIGVMRKEGVGTTTVLPVVLAAAMVVIPAGVIWMVYDASTSGGDARSASTTVVLLLFGGYFGTHLLAYTAYAFAHDFLPVPKDTEVVVTLGAGLKGARVPPLLAARLDRALEVRAGAVAPDEVMMVVSGGQGPDELVSEAEAMSRYLQDHGVPGDRILLEDKSTTTEENLEFTRAVLREHGLEKAGTVLCTNDFHAVRVAAIAREMEADMAVVGAPTAAYYRPAAFLREFVALLTFHWVRHTVVSLLILAAGYVIILTD